MICLLSFAIALHFRLTGFYSWMSHYDILWTLLLWDYMKCGCSNNSYNLHSARSCAYSLHPLGVLATRDSEITSQTPALRGKNSEIESRTGQYGFFTTDLKNTFLQVCFDVSRCKADVRNFFIFSSFFCLRNIQIVNPTFFFFFFPFFFHVRKCWQAIAYCLSKRLVLQHFICTTEDSQLTASSHIKGSIKNSTEIKPQCIILLIYPPTCIHAC